MNIVDNIKQNVIDHAKRLHELAKNEQPSPVDWAEIKQYLDEAGTFFETFVIEKIVIAARYSGGVTKIATFDVPERPDIEVKPEDSSASLVRDAAATNEFLAAGRNGAKP